MIIYFVVLIKEIQEQGRNYPWPRPEACLRCRHPKLWGHGFVPAYFDQIYQAIFLRRWRCPQCGAVYRMKPDGYFNRFWAPIKTIRQSMAHRIKTGRWRTDFSYSRQGNWFRALRRNIFAVLGEPFRDRLLEGFDRLMEMGLIPVSRSI